MPQETRKQKQQLKKQLKTIIKNEGNLFPHFYYKEGVKDEKNYWD